MSGPAKPERRRSRRCRLSWVGPALPIWRFYSGKLVVKVLLACIYYKNINLFYKITFAEELPMSETRFEALEGTKPILSVMMASVDKIVDTLQRDNILTNIDRLNIYSKKEETTERERAERLIDTVKRKTDHAYDGLVDALNSTGQEHCTTYLTKGSSLFPIPT